MTAAKSTSLPAEAWTLALLSLPELGPTRLQQLLHTHGSAEEAWAALCSGDRSVERGVSSAVAAAWRAAARGIIVADSWKVMAASEIACAAPESPGFPERLANDIEPPSLLFSLGQVPAGPSVALVGTRACTAYGQRCAFELAAALAAAGVTVVSGLALGIDAAAHRGALSVEGDGYGRPLGVVGSGLDVVYPKRNAKLWAEVAERGALISEAPPGVQPARWRFPARNRIIAAMADALVVVESHERGGSLLSVDEALERDVPVGVVPGPITSPASRGSNRLLAEGAVPVLSVDDVVDMVGLDRHRPEPARSDAPSNDVLNTIGWTPVLLEQLCLRTTRSPGEIAAAIEQLVVTGKVIRNGPWIERVQ